MQFSDEEIEADIKRIVETHIPAWKREAALRWLRDRIAAYKALERLG
jgi:hypothetical protein